MTTLHHQPQINNMIYKLAQAIGDAQNRLQGAAPTEIQSTSPFELINSFINTAIGILGVIAVLLIVYAGGLWLTAAGNDDKVGQAKKIIRTTVFGIIIVGLAYAITAFVLNFLVQ